MCGCPNVVNAIVTDDETYLQKYNKQSKHLPKGVATYDPETVIKTTDASDETLDYETFEMVPIDRHGATHKYNWTEPTYRCGMCCADLSATTDHEMSYFYI